jgi:chromosomal replication initiation ATPase DnaA
LRGGIRQTTRKSKIQDLAPTAGPVMELLHRYGGLKQRMIGERFGGLDEGLVSRDHRAIREKIETDPKIRKWFQDLVST